VVPQQQETKQLDCIHIFEMLMVLEQAVHLSQVFTAISVRQQHLVGLQLEMKQQVCTLHREMQVEMELVQNHQLNCYQFSEQLLQTAKAHNQQQKVEAFLFQQLGLVAQLLATKQLDCTPHLEPQLELVYPEDLQLMTKTQYQALQLDTGGFRPLLVEMK
jgi:hypothetical protein